MYSGNLGASGERDEEEWRNASRLRSLRRFACFFLVFIPGMLFCSLVGIAATLSSLPLLALLPFLLKAWLQLYSSGAGVTDADRVAKFLYWMRCIPLAFASSNVASPYATQTDLSHVVYGIPVLVISLTSAGGLCNSPTSQRQNAVLVATVITCAVGMIRMLAESNDPVTLASTAIPCFLNTLSSLGLVTSTCDSLRSARENLACELERSERLLALQTLTSRQLEQTKQATMRMLSGVCDCVFRVSSKLDITETSPQLLDPLMPGSQMQPSALSGRSLLQFLLPADGCALERGLYMHTLDVVSSTTPAAALLTTLRDDQGTQHAAHLYHTPISDSEHVVALRMVEIVDASSTSSFVPRHHHSLGVAECAENDWPAAEVASSALPTLPEDIPVTQVVGVADLAPPPTEPDLDDDAASGRHSFVSSTPSHAVFTVTGSLEMVSRSMRQIVDMGRRERWAIARRDLDLLPEKLFGQGGQGFVICGLLHGAPVAVKLSRDLPELSKLSDLCNELRVLRQVRHPNIATLYGACLSAQPADIAIVMELVDGVSLHKLIASGERAGFFSRVPSQLERKDFVQEVGSALLYLHSLHPVCVHGDVKPQNVMVQKVQNRYQTKLIDFGLARLMTSRSRPLGGSWHWVAPELLLGYDRPHSSAGVFSFGRLTFFVATGLVPLRGRRMAEVVAEMRSDARLPELEWPEDCALAEAFREVVSICCRWDACARPSMDDVCEATLSPGERMARAVARSSQEEGWHKALQSARGRLSGRSDVSADFAFDVSHGD